jgi:hypothetical protein
MNQNPATQISSEGNLMPNISIFHMNYWHEIVRTRFLYAGYPHHLPPRKILKFETLKKICLRAREGFKHIYST